MTALRKQDMFVDDFLLWAAPQPDRWELFDGLAVALSPERVVHGEVKYRVARALDAAIATADVPCRFVRMVIHHARSEGDVVATRIVTEGVLRLDPPRIELAVADLLPR
jgi:hypothetical protein